MSLGEAVEKQEKVSGKWKKFLFFLLQLITMMNRN